MQNWITLLLGIAIIGIVIACTIAARLAGMRHREAEMYRVKTAEFQKSVDEHVRSTDNIKSEFSALMEGCGAGVIVLDEADQIEHSSTEACRLLGVKASHLLGKTLLQATLSAELNSCLKLVRASRLTHTCEIKSHLTGKGNGSNNFGTCMAITISPVCSKSPNDTFRCIVIVSDVTELRRLETVRRDFVANVSHELRTPLTSIRAMAETLQDGALRDGEVADHFLATISTEAQRLTRISEDLLVLSHAESRPTEFAQIQLSTLLSDVVNRFQNQADTNAITLSSSIEPEICVNGSQDQFEQVFINLIDNAIKYSQAGGKVCLSSERKGSFVAIHVSDNGIGIMSQDVSRIFERFYRVDKARSRQSGGTGLGLSIVKHIVEAHGGTVQVESQYNHGSTFTVSLPVCE